MIKIIIEDDDTIVGIKDKHSWTLEDTVSVFETTLNKFFNSVVLPVPGFPNRIILLCVSKLSNKVCLFLYSNKLNALSSLCLTIYLC